MRIGIDSRLLSERITGIGRYLSEIVSRMIINYPEHEFYLYSHRPITNINTDFVNVHLRTLNIKSTVGRMLWSQSILTYQALGDKLDVFWGPSHRLPFLLSRYVPMVLTIHDFVWMRFPETMRMHSRMLDKFMVPMAIKKARRIICVSNATKSDLYCALPNLSTQVDVVYLGASLTIKQRFANCRNKYFLFVGTCEPRKNLHRLLEAFSKFKKNTESEFRLVICGGRGWGGVNVESMVKKFDLDQYVDIMGYVDDVELSSLYANAYSLLMPSLYEGFGLPIVEAIANGLPSIISNISSMPEVGLNTAIYVNPKSIEDILAALNLMAFDEKLHDELANNCRLHISKYNWDVATVNTFNVIQSTSKGFIYE